MAPFRGLSAPLLVLNSRLSLSRISGKNNGPTPVLLAPRRHQVSIGGNARFEELTASHGGAIYNGDGAAFELSNGATALFRGVGNTDGQGSALFNRGFFQFSGPALFVDADSPAIVAFDGSETFLSESSAFWDVGEPGAEAISVGDDSADITIPGSVTFVGFVEPALD